MSFKILFGENNKTGDAIGKRKSLFNTDAKIRNRLSMTGKENDSEKENYDKNKNNDDDDDGGDEKINMGRKRNVKKKIKINQTDIKKIKKKMKYRKSNVVVVDEKEEYDDNQ